MKLTEKVSEPQIFFFLMGTLICLTPVGKATR